MNDLLDIDRRVAFATFAIAAGVLSLLLLVLPVVYSPRAPVELLPFFESHRSIYILLAVTILIWVIVSIPSVVAVGAMLSAQSRSLALAATLLSAGGILLLGFAVFAFIGALLAIVASATAAPSTAAAAYQAAIWSNLSFFLADPGLMTLGFGQFLFAWLAWNSGTFPKAVSVGGFVGGLSGLLTLVTYQTSLLAVIQLGAFGVWAAVIGAKLLRLRPTELRVFAERKPDFSGDYVLNRQASTLSSGAAGVRSALLRIEHREPTIRCQAAFKFDRTSFDFSLERVSDGREVVDGKEPPTTSSLHWDGHALVFIERTDAADAPVTMSWRYELEDGGRRLTATERIRGGGRDQDNVWVFDRR